MTTIHRTVNSFVLIVALLALAACSPAPSPAASAGLITQAAPSGADPLPSWSDSAAKTSIIKFVAGVTNPTADTYIPPEERIVVTDNDGTLWTEKPIPAQADFVNTRIKEMAAEHPEWQTTMPYQAVLQNDRKALASLTEGDAAKLIAVTHAGMPVETFMDTAQKFLATSRHPRFDVLYTQTVYQPMLELLAFLRVNGFKTYIVSGGGTDFMRAFAEPIYGIPPENVIGSSLKYEFKMTPAGPVILRTAEIDTFDNEDQKPVNIQRVIGRRPILAIGNSDGDLQMFQYVGASKEPFLVLLVVHDDAEREYEYIDGAEAVLDAAEQNQWTSVSMKRDFMRVFAFDAAQ